jgi:hypothetical protein
MSDTEKAFQVVKDLLLDDTFEKTERDQENLNQMLESIKLRVKLDIVEKLLTGKKEEVIATLDEYISALESKISEMESKPFGAEKSVPELMSLDHKMKKNENSRQIRVYKEILEDLKQIRQKAENIKYEDAVRALFSDELESDRLLRYSIMMSLSGGGWSLSSFDGEFPIVGMKDGPNNLEHSARPDWKINFEFVDRISSVIFDKEKVEKYSTYFEKEYKYHNKESALTGAKEQLEIVRWYKGCKPAIDGIVEEKKELNRQIYSLTVSLQYDTAAIDSRRRSIASLKSNYIKAFIHKKEINELEQLIAEGEEIVRKKQDSLAELEERNKQLETHLDTLLHQLQDRVSKETFNKIYFAAYEITSSRWTREKKPEHIDSKFNRLVNAYGNEEEIQKSIDTLTKEAAEAKADFEEYAQTELSPEMRKEITEKHDDIRAALWQTRRGPNYRATPFVSLCILKTISEARHLDPKKLLEYLETGETLEETSERLESRIESRITGFVQPDIKAVNDKFRKMQVPPVKPEKKQQPAVEETRHVPNVLDAQPEVPTDGSGLTL